MTNKNIKREPAKLPVVDVFDFDCTLTKRDSGEIVPSKGGFKIALSLSKQGFR